MNEINISLRDYFAAKAMQGFCAREDDITPFNISVLAEYCYAIADAMLAEREKGE